MSAAVSRFYDGLPAYALSAYVARDFFGECARCPLAASVIRTANAEWLTDARATIALAAAIIDFLAPLDVSDRDPFACDAVIAMALDSIGLPESVKIARQIREAIKVGRPDPLSVWRFGFGEAPLIIRGVARALWRDRVLPALAKSAALVTVVHAQVTGFHSPWARRAALPVEGMGKRMTVTFAEHTAEIIPPTTMAAFDADTIIRGLERMGGVTAHRLFRYLVFAAHDRHVARTPYANVLEIEGGYAGLAERVGLNARDPNVIHALHEILQAHACSWFQFPDGTRGNMIIVTERPARGHQRAHLTLTLGPALLPGYAADQRRKIADRRLIPLLRTPPPLHGRPNEWGAQYTASMATVAEMRERAAQMVEAGGAELSTDTWTRIGDRSGVRRADIPAVRETWLAGTRDKHGRVATPPLLKRVERGFYTLADSHVAEREFLLQGGRIEIGARKGGRVASEKRRARIAAGK